MKTTILLDAGGVLIDESNYETAVCRAIVKILKQSKFSYNQENYWQDVNESIARYCPSTPKYILWKHTNPDLIKYNVYLEQYYTDIKQHQPPLTLFEGIEDELLQLSKRFKLVIAGQYGKIVLDLLKQKDLLGLFENQLTQDAFDITKPDPRFLEQIAHCANAKPIECIMVGDRIDKDVIPGRQNGMGTVFLRTGIYKDQKPRIPEEIPDLILESIEGMATMIIQNRTWN